VYKQPDQTMKGVMSAEHLVGKSARRVGVVLSTGDLRGVFAHTGFLSALAELGISYQAMAGTSAGAIVAAIIASGKDVREFADWLKGLNVNDYWERDSLATMLYQVAIRRGRGYTGIVSTDRLEKTIAGLLRAPTFEACPIPVYLIATNITKGAKEVFHSGELAPRAVASAAIPALVKAKRIGESYYVDGGVFELTPRSAICCREKLDVLIVNQIPPGFDRVKGDNQFLQEWWSLMHLVGRVLDAIYEHEMAAGSDDIAACPCGCTATILTLAPQLDPMDRLKPEEGMQLLRQGYEETLRLLPGLLERLAASSAQPIPKGTMSCD
jgi:predicted acylesterase/phospholipase RssA